MRRVSAQIVIAEHWHGYRLHSHFRWWHTKAWNQAKNVQRQNISTPIYVEYDNMC